MYMTVLVDAKVNYGEDIMNYLDILAFV